MNLFDVKEIKAFDIITGPGSNRERALQIIDFVYNFYKKYPDASAEEQAIDEYRDLAEKDTVDNADLDWLTQWISQTLEDDLPEYCYLKWQEGQLVVIPDAHDAAQNLVQRDDRHWDDEFNADANPDHDDHIFDVNDHGNVTLFEWKYSEKDGFVNTLQHEWVEVWAVV